MQKMKASQREAELRDLVITGLSHLVISNSESGFKQCLSLAYSDDNLKRTIFSHVFARVLGQGARLEVEEIVSGVSRIGRLAEVNNSHLLTCILLVDISTRSSKARM